MITATPSKLSVRCVADFLSPVHMEMLQGLMTNRKMAEGAYVCWEGDSADQLFFVKAGAVKLVKSTEDGKAFMLQVARRGDLFGEFGDPAVLTFGYDAIALEETTVGAIRLDELERLLAAHGKMAVELFQWMAYMQRVAQSKFHDLLLFGKSGALASTIVRLSNSCGSEAEQGIRIGVKLTHTDLAQMIGATRESVNRMLSEFKSAGALDIVKGYMLIRNLDYFTEMAGCADWQSDVCRI